MDIRLNLGNLDTPQDIQRLTSIIAEMADSLDTLVSTTAPNGNISGRQGQVYLYNNSGTYTVWINSSGSTTWQQVDVETGIPLTYLDTDGTLAANSDTKVASQKATKTYVDTKVPVPLTAPLGGTGATAAANAASGVVVLNASSQLPAVSGALLTGISKASLGIDSGTVSYVGTAKAISFNFTFASAPIVLVTWNNSTGNPNQIFNVTGIGTTGCTIDGGGATGTLVWIAVGTKA